VILLDTHTWLWWVSGAPEPPMRMKALITTANEPVAIASMSCLEVAWLAKKGRIALPVTVDQFFERAIEKAGLQLLPLTPKIAARSAALPDIHRDPVDRVLVATALELDAVLATKDSVIPSYPDVRVRWDV
jgi:PIN domain nuclease of toxin-antitoxin system